MEAPRGRPARSSSRPASTMNRTDCSGPSFRRPPHDPWHANRPGTSRTRRATVWETNKTALPNQYGRAVFPRRSLAPGCLNVLAEDELLAFGCQPARPLFRAQQRQGLLLGLFASLVIGLLHGKEGVLLVDGSSGSGAVLAVRAHGLEELLARLVGLRFVIVHQSGHRGAVLLRNLYLF